MESDVIRYRPFDDGRFRQFREQLQVELARIDCGEETVLDGDEALAEFLEELKNEVKAEFGAENP